MHRFKQYISRLLIAVASVFPCLGALADDSADIIRHGQGPDILIVNSYHSAYPWTVNQNKGFIERISKTYPDSQFYFEFLDTKRIPISVGFEAQKGNIAYKYSRIGFELVYATDDDALAFCLKYRRELGLERIPIVASGINDGTLLDVRHTPGLHGIIQTEGTLETIKFALERYPQADKVVIITDSSSSGKAIADEITQQARIATSLPIMRSPPGSWQDTLDFITRMDGHPIFIIGIYAVTGDGSYMQAAEVARNISLTARGPVFVCHDLYPFDAGQIGGSINIGQDAGMAAAAIALSLLDGSGNGSLPRTSVVPQRWVINHQALKRLGMSTAKLPANAIIVGKRQNVIERNPLESAFVVLGILLQSALIGFLLLTIRRRQAVTRELRHNEAQLRMLIEHSPLPISISNTEGKVLYLNSNYKKIIGYDQSELPDIETLKRLTIPDADYRQQVWSQIEERIRISRQTGVEMEPLEYKVVSKDGREVELEMHFAFVGELNFRIFNDISVRNKALRELKAATREAQHASEAKSRFLANVSHEIRTPMNGIMGMVQLLRETPIRDDQKDYIDTIQDSCDLLVTVINDILDLSKIESGKLTLERENLDLRAFLRGIAGVAAPGIEAKGLEFICDVDENIPHAIVADQQRLKQVLLNLLVNACKFTDKGHVSLKVSGSGTPGNIGSLYFEVEDTGIGIPDDQQDRVFEPFIQADNSSTRKHGGTGLGLSICKRLVEMMGGELKLSSSVGKGSTFSFDIRVAIVHPVLAATPQAERIDVRLGSNYPMKILLAEDNSVNQKVALMMLRKMGYNVQLANNGHEAYQLMQALDFDLVLMDIQMPVMDGLEATRLIREHLPSCRQPRIIALTAHAMGDDVSRCTAAGMDGHLAKPLRSTLLRNALVDAYHDMRIRRL